MRKQKKLRNKKYMHEIEVLRKQPAFPDRAHDKAIEELIRKTHESLQEASTKWHPHDVH